MDSHSRSASPRDPMRPQHRPPSPPSSPAAFDNRAYQHDESDPNHNDSFTSNGPHQNGHSKEPNGDTKTLEAVNLELINLTPKNGAKKKDVEVDMNATNPYDEYFVPVNEHRKYMRGEKLYVTADKRGEKGGCKRPLCWTLLGLVVAAIVALIVLAATGILFTNSPTPLEQYNASVSSARAFGGITSDHGHDHHHDHSGHHHDHSDHNHDHDHSDHDHHEQEPSTSPPQPVTETQSDEGQVPSFMSNESSDMSMYVPRTLEGELKIDNIVFFPDFKDTESEVYKEFTSIFSKALKHALMYKNNLDNGDNEIMVEVIKLRKGSVIVTYRVHWIPKHNAEPTEDLITEKSFKTALNSYLDIYNRMLSVYHVAEEEDLSTKPVLDLCKVNNNDCEYKCEFDDSILDFTCVCPHGQMLDTNSFKKCTPILDNFEPNQIHLETTTQNVLTVDSNEKTIMPISEEKSNTETVREPNEQNMFDWNEGRHYISETTTEIESDVNYSHIFGHTDTEIPKPEPIPEHDNNATVEPHSSNESEEQPEPEPTAEPKPEPEPEPSAEPKPEPTVESGEEPEPVPTAEPKSVPEPEPTAEPKPEPTAEPKAEPEPAVEPNTESEPELTALPKAEPEPEPTAEPKAEAEPEPKAEPEPEPTVEPKAEPEPTAATNSEEEPNTKIETASEIIQSVYQSITGLSNEPESVTNPNIESEPKLETTTQFTENFTDMSNTNMATIVDSIFGDTDEHKQSEATKLKTTPKPMFDHPTFDLDSLMGLHTTSEPFQPQRPETVTEEQISLEDKKIESVNETNDKTENNMDNSMATTVRISISEPNIINEPSYEPKPEIITILQQNGDSMSSSDINNEDNDWLEADENSTTSIAPQTTSMIVPDDDFMKTQTENEMSDDRVSKSESRSSKTLEDFVSGIMTEDTSENINDGITFDMIRKNNEMPSESTTVKMHMETSETVTSNSANMDDKDTEDESNNVPIETTTSARVFTNKMIDQNYENTMNLNQNNMATTTQSGNNIIITSQSEGSKIVSLNENQGTETTTTEMSQQNKDLEDDKNEMETLEKTTVSSKISNDQSLENENKDITFDSINMLYNRSSKSIIDKENNMEDITESNEILKDSVETTTDSDWLSESVTEVNIEDIAKNGGKTEATETPAMKVDEIMGRGLMKDDFEPDYLNNMGSNSNKTSDSDEVMYGVSQDYENDDSRVKRVNAQDNSEVSSSVNVIEASTLNSKNSFETTTIGQYIYKVAEKTNETVINPETTITTSRPAPVWEETEKEPTVDEISKSEMNENNQMNDNMNIATSTAMPTTTVLFNNDNQENLNQENFSNTADMSTQNTTQVNNLNVTIYEISNPNDTQSFITTKPTNAQSSEFVDHETEMNPFLPEVENNKSLVKKLQEGHDIEPTNLNETQNENVEDHNINNTDAPPANESNLSSSEISPAKETTAENDLSVIAPKDSATTTNPDNAINQLFTNINSRVEEPITTKTTTETNKQSTNSFTSFNEEQTSEKSGNKEVLPLSTFLLDTDDLDTTKRPTASPENDLSYETEATNSKSIKEIDNEYLSVVPIEPENNDERLKKDYNSESIQELNFISDSPKKSDRRTDVSNFDSVLNNEA